MKRNRRIKIVATLGPASQSPEVMEQLFVAGVDVFRINMSHASHELANELCATVRKLASKHRHSIGVLCDLQGPKFRVGEFHAGRVFVNQGDDFHFDCDEKAGDTKRVFLPHPQIFEAVKPGHHLLLDDGKIRMRVTENANNRITAQVLTGGALASRKGIALPETILPVGPLTKKDLADLECALKMKADWIALSFVQRHEDVAEVKKIVNGRAAVMVKIEKPAAIDDLEAIIETGDGFMVARGDLGVELPVERVPSLQKTIVRQARTAGKPVIVATQMLESMISSPVPTRAEVSDVATAVFDGADAVMLSAESAVGQYPVEAIKVMNRIAAEVETDPSYDTVVHAVELAPLPTGADAIAAAAHAIADTLELGAIVCYTATGSTALRVARERPGVNVIGLTPIEQTAQRLSLVWGIQTILTSDPKDLADMVRKACRIPFDEGFVKAGQGLVITAGVPLGSPGATNMIRIAYLTEEGLPDGHTIKGPIRRAPGRRAQQVQEV